ncbi:MAG: hypothetical protein QXH17_08680 [Candidatus Bathyarchaeia archaeon]
MKIADKILLFILFALICGCCMYPVRYDGPYRGKVVDAETGEPIEGVVVLGVWYSSIFSITGSPFEEFYDAMETVTDKNGEYFIEGMGLRLFSNLKPMHAIYYKSGYYYVEMWDWDRIKGMEISVWDNIRRIEMKGLTWEGDKPIIHLRKLTTEERKKVILPGLAGIPNEKMKLMMKEHNKELKWLGINSLYPED